MLSTNRILLFVATVILCGLLFGLELGLILLITAVVCFNSYEPFSNGNELENQEDFLEDELEEECKLQLKESESSKNSNACAAEKKGKKMSLWQPRKSAAVSVRIAKPESHSPKRLSNVSSPSARPPLRYTGSPFGKSMLRPDKNVSEDRENASLWGNPYSPTAKRKPAQPSNQSNTSAGPLLSSPFLPRVKRAIGVGEAALLQQQSHSPRRSNYGMSGVKVFSPQHKALPYPSISSPGVMPLVRLGRHEKPILNENNSNMVHSPVTVKIAAPSPRRLNFTSRLSLSEDREGVIRRAPDKETVLSALREKSRKRGIPTQDESVSEVNDQQSKRRKQDDSTSSSSSMVSEPEFLAELPVNGYSNIPLHMAGMKRPATPTVDLDLHVSPSLDRVIKRAKKDTRNNSIVSSLSSSRRGMAKEMKEFQRGEKRKPEESNQSFEKEPISKQTRKDIQLPACSVTSTPIAEGRTQPRIPEKSKTLMDTPSQTVPPVTEEIKPPQSLKKKILCNAEQASQKVKKGVDIDFMSPRSKQVMSLDVTTNPEDYDRDPAAVRQRAVDMLADINGETNTTSDKDKGKNGNGFPLQSGQASSLAVSSAILLTTTAAAATTTTTSTISGGTTPSALTALLNSEDKTKTGSNSGGLLSSVLFSSSNDTKTTTSQLTSSAVPVSSTSNVASTTSSAAATVQNGTATDVAQQFSFKPVFPVASTSVTAIGTSQQGGFSLAGAKTSAATAPIQASETIATPAASSATVTAAPLSAAPSAFSFGNATQSNATASPALASSQTPLNFSSGATVSKTVPQKSTANSAVFGFGAPSQSVATSTVAAASSSSTVTPAAAFSFGGASNPAKPSDAPAPFAFGQTPSSTPAATTQNSSVGFGGFQSTAATAPSANSSLFSFGSTQKPATTTTTTSSLSAGGFGMTTPATTAASSQISAFGSSATTASSQQPSGFAFGQSTTSAVTQNMVSNPATAGFVFGTSTTATTQSSTQPSSTSLFSFGSSASANSIPTAGLGFGSNSTPAQPSSTSGFNFNAAASNTTPFAQSGSKGSIFGGATTASQSATGTPAFGSQPANTAVASSSVFGSSGGSFSFGQSTAPAFGQTSTTAASTGFGSSTAAATTTKTASSTFQFGATNSGAQSSFGTSTPSFNFGASSNNASSTGSAFGAKPSSSLPVPTFGQSSGSAFGSFGSQQSSSVFGGGQSQPAGSAPSFGQASSTSAFGSTNQGSFSFGQSSNPAPATPVKGFDFTAAASGTPSLQFGSSGNQGSGFSTPNQKTPVMNFGSVTPGASTPAFGGGGFGAPAGGMFSVGSGTTAPRPRSRARRRGNKR